MPTGAIPFPFGKCRICNDKATGVHYGVATCEGCKGFFKRSISKADKYRCFFGGNCNLTPKNRNRCKSCRFKRCMKVGMALDAVKMGRIPKVEKERALEVVREKSGEEPSETNGDHDGSGSRKTPSTSSGFCSDAGEDGGPKDQEATLQLKAFHKANDEAESNRGLFPLYNPQQESGHGPPFPEQGTRQHIDVSSSVKTEEMGHNMPYSSSRQVFGKFSEPQVAENGRKALGPVPVDHSTAAHVQGRNSNGHVNAVAPRPQVQGPVQNETRDRELLKHEAGTNGLGVGSHQRGAICAWPNSSNGSRSGESALKNTSNATNGSKESGLRSPGLTPASVYSSTVIKQLFTHALENICQDGEKVQLMEKFLQTHIGTRKGETRQTTSSDATAPLTSSGARERLPDILNTGANHSHVVKMHDSGGRKRKAQNDGDVGPNQKSVRHSDLASYMNCPADPRHGTVAPDQPHSIGSYGMHKLPPILPQQSAAMRAVPLRPGQVSIPSSLGNTSQDFSETSHPHLPLEPEHDWYGSWSDSLFEEGDMGINQRQAAKGVNFPAQLPSTCQEVRIKQEHQNDSCNSSNCFASNNLQYPASSDTNVVYGQVQNNPLQRHEDNFADNTCGSKTWCDGSSSNTKSDYSESEIRSIAETIFSNFASSSQVAEVLPNDKSPKLPPNDNDCFPLDDIKMEVIDYDSLKDEELVQILEKAYSSIEVLSLSMIKKLHDGVKNGTYLDMTIPPDSPKPKRGDVQYIWNLLFQNVEPCGVRVANFCQTIPGFSQIDAEDKDLLVTSAFFDLWMICHSPLFYKGEVHILFPQDDTKKYCRYWMKQFLPETLIRKFFEFADMYNSCSLTVAEVAIVLAIRATLPERPGLKDIEPVKKLNSRYLNLLVQSVIASHPSEGGNILKKLFMALPLLQGINEEQNKVIGNFRIDDIPCRDDDPVE